MELVFNCVSWAACSVSVWIAALHHKSVDNPMEFLAIVESFVCKIDEVLGCNGCFVCIQLNLKCSFCCIKYCCFHIAYSFAANYQYNCQCQNYPFHIYTAIGPLK